MTGDERRAVVGLWCTPGIGPRAIARVRSVFGSLAAVADEPVRKWLSSVPLPAGSRAGLEQLQTTLGEQAELTLERVDRLGMKVAFLDDPTYPRGLAELPSAPPLLFYRGRADRPNGPKRLAMVGSRHFEPNFIAPGQKLARELATRLIIVSGAAVGIDQLCHRAALAVGGETWAFMGGALDTLDPPQAEIGAEMLEKGGTLFSEFPPNVRAARRHFPRRNRLISGASDAVLLLRGDGESGALHTISYARAQKRLVLAVPGQIDHQTAHSPNQLIRAGLARLVERAQDVFEDMGLDNTSSPAAAPSAPAVDLTTLSSNAQRAFVAVERLPADFDLLLSRAGPLDSGQLASALIELELAGLLVLRPGRRYERR